MTERKKQALIEKLEETRARLMIKAPLYALLLMYMNFIATDTVKTVSVNSTSIIFSPAFLSKLKSDELDFVLCHLLLHVLYDDIHRDISLKGDSYHHACDIVINSALKQSGFEQDKYPHLGRIFNKLLNIEISDITAEKVYEMLPYKLSSFAPYEREGFLFDTDKYWGMEDRDINDGVLVLEGVSGEFRNVIESEKEAENEECRSSDGQSSGNSEESEESDGEEKHCVTAKPSGKSEERNYSAEKQNVREVWLKRFAAINSQIMSENGKDAGKLPLFLQRRLAELKKPAVDWKNLLINFVSEQVRDYSFSPPDRRYSDSEFFLPDFNESECEVKNIWFLVDTSGSMDEEMLSAAYSEIYGAIEQFNGKIEGEIGFFDTEMKSLQKFCSKQDLKSIMPVGGGGTDFNAPFDYISEKGITKFPNAIVIFTDGYGPYPETSKTFGIPVMWLLTDTLSEPPFGKTVRMNVF